MTITRRSFEVRRLRAWWGAMPGAYRPHLKLYRGQAVRILTLSGWERYVEFVWL